LRSFAKFDVGPDGSCQLSTQLDVRWRSGHMALSNTTDDLHCNVRSKSARRICSIGKMRMSTLCFERFDFVFVLSHFRNSPWATYHPASINLGKIGYNLLQSSNVKENPANSPGTLVLLLPRASWASLPPARWLPRPNTELEADASCLSISLLTLMAWSVIDLEYLDDAGLSVALADAPLGE
jgi:hypothetical protein